MSLTKFRKDISMDNRTYDTIKIIALACVPICAFIGSLCSIWSVPHADQITTSLTALDTLLGALVVIFAREYNKPMPMDISELDYIEDEVAEDE